jgi:endonuclease/exonuclease/phosphatase (EEP) superfamily protein YafD
MKTNFNRQASLWLFTFSLFYGMLLAVITAINHFGADSWWFGALNLYLPQAMWLVPGVLLFLISLWIDRRKAWLPGLCIIWVLGPIMGLCWSLHPSPDPGGGAPTIRVMTCNVKYGRHDIKSLFADIDHYAPDVVLFQDAGGILEGPFRDYFRKWHLRSFAQYVIAARLPLGEAEVRQISFPGGKLPCLRCQILFEGASITLYNVHFESPREGLNAFRAARRQPWYLPKAILRLDFNVEDRLIQAGKICEFVRRESGAVIVAGDLNSPDSSRVCATLRDAGLHDAFAEGGRGYGYTYGHYLLQNRLPWLHVSWMRIDHIVMSSQLESRRCWTGTGKASDHRPVIADLALKIK